MLELDALQAARKTDQHALARLKKARNYYLVGMTCLKAAIDSGATDSHLYEKASELFLRSIRFNRADSAPYLSLAYLLLLFHEPARAIPYIQHVLRQDAQNSEALNLNQEAQKQVSSHSQQTAPVNNSPTEPAQPRRLKSSASNNSLENKLDKALTMAQRLSQGIKATCQPDVFQRLEGLDQRLEKKYLDIFDSMTQQGLSRTPETQEQLKEYQNILTDLKQVIEQSQKLIFHQEDLEDLLDEVEDLLETLENHPPESFQKSELLINQFFERYETLADAVDLLESQKIDIGELTPLFDELAQALGDLQEMIAKNKLKSALKIKGAYDG